MEAADSVRIAVERLNDALTLATGLGVTVDLVVVSPEVYRATAAGRERVAINPVVSVVRTAIAPSAREAAS